MAVALAVVTLVVAWPGIHGTWIYDDVLMATSPLMDDVDDLLATPQRTSLDWFAARQSAPLAQMSGFTWRPVTMGTLVATNVAFPGSPLAHHLVGWALHALVVALLVGTAVRRRALSASSAALIAAFALHPAFAEAWVWINGRSDVMAGVWLAALGVVVADRHAERCPGALALVAIASISAMGALSKETFLPASGVLVVAPWVPADRRGWIELRAAWRARLLPVTAVVGAWGVAAFGALVGRGLVGRDAAASLGSGDGLGVLLERTPALLLLAVESIASPLPRSMRMLATALEQEPSAATWAAGLIAAAVMVALVVQRNARALLLGFGALVALLPTASVASYDWLGFDRYLYLPAMLAVFGVLLAEAVAPHSRIGAPATRVAAALAVAWTLLLAIGLHLTARAYRGPAEWASAMIDTQPEDPAGYVVRARQIALQGRGDRAAALLDVAPIASPPAPIVHALAEVFLAAGRPDRAAAVLDEAGPRYPDHLFVQYDLMSLRMAQGRWDEAGRIADRLLVHARSCEATRAAWQAVVQQDPQRLADAGGRHASRCPTGAPR